MEALCDASKPGRFFRQVCRIRRGDGVLRWAEISGQFDFAAEGEPLRFVGVLADVTERMEVIPRSEGGLPAVLQEWGRGDHAD